VIVQGKVKAGDGGHTWHAIAIGAETSNATARTPGQGGNVVFSVDRAPQVLDFASPKPGNGGDCGLFSLTEGQSYEAYAIAHLSATAIIDGGGKPGLVIQRWGTGGSSTDDTGEGGDRGIALACTTVAGCDEKSGASNNGPIPAPGATATSP